MDVMGIELVICTAYHTQTNGQSERAYRTVEVCCGVVNPQQVEWCKYMPVVEFGCNDSL